MASFTDQIMKYNPYVTQLPVEDYVGVGMMLQDRYNQGVQRVQGMIDQVAGMPVATDADRQYLNEKLGGMRNQISKVISGDFGKLSLQNQVGSLVGSISSDPVIKTAVESAAKLKSEQTEWSELKKSHPELYSSINYAKWQSDVGKYLEQGKTKAGLEYTGTPVVSGTGEKVRERIINAVDKLKTDGLIDVDQQGNVIRKTKYEELSPEKVRQYIQSLLSANDQQILANEGWYYSQGQTDAEVAKDAHDFYGEYADYYQRQKQLRSDALEVSDGMDENTKSRLKSEHDNFEQYENNYRKNQDQIRSGAVTRDQAATSYWTERMVSGLANSLAYRKMNDLDLAVNPELTAQLTIANIQKTIAETNKLLGETRGGGFGPSTTSPVDINPNDKRVTVTGDTYLEVSKGNEAKAAQLEVQSASAALTDEFGQPLPGNENDVDVNGTVANNTKSIEKGKNYADASKIYYDAAATGNVEVKPGENIPGYNAKVIKVAQEKLKTNAVQQKWNENEKMISEKAVANTGYNPNRASNIKKLNGQGNYTVAELQKIYDRDTHEVSVVVPGGGPPVTARDTSKGTELEKLENKYGSRSVRDDLTQEGYELAKYQKEKERLYRQDYVVNPIGLTIGVSNTGEKTDEYDLMQKIISQSTSITDRNVRSVDASQTRITDFNSGSANDIKPLKFFTVMGAQGKMSYFIRAEVKGNYGGNTDKTKQFDLDVTKDIEGLRKNYMSTNAEARSKMTMLERVFLTDSAPELTYAMMLPGAQKVTTLDPKNMKDAFIVTSNNQVARKWALGKTSDNKFYVRVAVPTGKNTFNYFNLPAAGGTGAMLFENAGQAEEAVNLFYNRPDILKIESQYAK